MVNDMSILPPGKTIGILGGGQLGKLLAIGAAKLGFNCHIYCPESESPAFSVAKYNTVAKYNDLPALEKFAQQVDIITYEFENIPITTVKYLEKIKPIFPDSKALAITQDRALEKEFLNSIKIDTVQWGKINIKEDIDKAIDIYGLPIIFKTRKFGYDGKGQIKLSEIDNIGEIYNFTENQPVIFEQQINFDKELSIIITRSKNGEVAYYDTCENIHKNHVLSKTIVPATINSNITDKAVKISQEIVNHLNYVGTMAVEMFYIQDTSSLIINELAPRVHNSGHWTMDACITDQFEQHIRGICGLNLGSTYRYVDIEMNNLIGSEIKNWPEIISNKSCSLHIYGKKEEREGRKMGHFTKIIKS